MTTQEANKLIAEFMGLVVSDRDNYTSELHTNVDADLKYHTSWDWLMPVISKVKNIDAEWAEEQAQHIWAFRLWAAIDDIDDALTCCWGIDEVYRYTVDAIMNYNEYKS
tara:strand:+ start:535 stop:861 length:327 start_codon:yes stop_codon:yes gene_type:complete